MKKVKTFTATIYVGFRKNYSDRIVDPIKIKEFIQHWVDTLGMCVTVRN